MNTTPPKPSDLPVRAASAVVMIAVAGTALWLGGWVWTAFVAAVAMGVLWEWWGLVAKFGVSSPVLVGFCLFGIVYVTLAAAVLLLMRDRDHGAEFVLAIVGSVVAVDVGAYFAGRAFGGPKIAPKISPSKTWAGLGGGIAGAIGAILLAEKQTGAIGSFHLVVAFGAATAIIAQSGDFFESWMKRRAGVKDSSNLIPGHGGLFDRVDGLLAVCFMVGIFFASNIAAFLVLPYPQ